MTEAHGPIAWEESFDKALERAYQEDRPVLAYFMRDT